MQSIGHSLPAEQTKASRLRSLKCSLDYDEEDCFVRKMRQKHHLLLSCACLGTFYV